MEENIVVNVAFEGHYLGNINEIQVVPSNIAWEDLELMLKVYADQDNLVIKYKDEDNDDITVSTQEELHEAFKIAKRCNNTLCLFVDCRPSGKAVETGTKDGNFVVTANLMDQSVTMETAEKESDVGEKPEDAAGETEPKTATEGAVAMETEKVAAKADCPACVDCFIIDQEAPQKDKTSEKPKEKPSKYFYIKNKSTGLVLDINGGNASVGTAIIVWTQKSGSGMDIANQLWYSDDKTSTIRSAMHDLCLDITSVNAVVKEYQSGKTSQQWVLMNGHIQHHFNPNWVVVLPGAIPTPGVRVRAAEASSIENKGWHAEYKDFARSKPKCTNRETGEMCSTKVCRPKAPKRGKKDIYAEMAKEIGKNPQLLHYNIPAVSSPKKQKSADTSTNTSATTSASTSTNTSASTSASTSTSTSAATSTSTGVETDDSPPTWFFKYMDKFKKEITEDMAKMVARRTVHQVLKGLNNAVIDTVKVTESGLVRTPGVGATQIPGTSGETAYCHDGVQCDQCQRLIVGIRYKCGNCEDFDLCDQCEAGEINHDSEHVFLKIRRPAPSAGRKRNGRIIPLLKENLYGSGDEEDRSPEVKRDEKQKRKEDKLLHKYEKLEEKMRRKEEKLKRRLETTKELPKKKEKLDLPQFRVLGSIDVEFIRDETIPDGTHVQPGEHLVKEWLVRNTGALAWADDFMLTMMWGNMAPLKPDVKVPPIEPGELGVISVELIAPEDPGVYQSHWRLSVKGRRYGHRVWCSIIVDSKEPLEPCDEDETMTKVSDDETEVDKTSFPVINMPTKAASEPPTPAPQEDGTGTSDLHPILSYETLAIANRPRAKASQTATPNNTPRDVTPPKSPIPEHRGLSTSSSVEIVSIDKDDDVTDEDTMSRMTELVQERMASLGLKAMGPDNDDLDSWSSCDEDFSDDTDSDFYVVPIPDCFNPELPAATCASTSICVKKDECRSIDEILTASHSLESQPVLMPEVAVQEEMAVNDPHDEVQLVDTPDETDATDDVIIVRVELPGQAANEETVVKEVEPVDEEPEPEGAVGGVNLVQEPRVENDEETDQNANLPLDINDNSAGTPNQEDNLTGTPNQEDNSAGAPNQEEPVNEGAVGPSLQRQGSREGSPNQSELTIHMMSAARGVASYASHAAQSAYTTAKDVFHTLQANNQYTPKQSDWTPPTNTWSPPQSTWTPNPSTWTPTEQRIPFEEVQSPIDLLIEMGFGNRDLNISLLEKHDNDVEKVIQELVQMTDSEWHNTRH